MINGNNRFILQAMRILIFVSLGCQVCGLVCGVFGFSCTSIGNQRPDMKYRLVSTDPFIKNSRPIAIAHINFSFFLLNWHNFVQNVSSLIFHIFGIVALSIGTLWITIPMLKNYYKSKDNNQVNIFVTCKLILNI